MAEQDPATSTVGPNVWVLFVLQFLASETAMIGRQYQISPECNRNLWSLNQNEIFTFHFLSDRDMGNCNVGWAIRSHPSLYHYRDHFLEYWYWYQKNLVLVRKWKHRWHHTGQISWSAMKKLEKNLQSTTAAVLIVQRSSFGMLISLSVMFFTGIHKVDHFSWITQAHSLMF